MADDREPRADDIAKRLEKLGSALDARRSATQKDAQESGNSAANAGQAINLGFRVMSEFVAAIVVGGLLGWQGDKWAGTSPFLLILFVTLGTAAGFWSVYRIATGQTGRAAQLHDKK